MFVNLFKIIVGIGLIIGGVILQVMWLGFLFGSVIGVVLVLIFARHLLIMPFTIGLVAGMAFIGSVDDNLSIDIEDIIKSARSTLKGVASGIVRVLVWVSWAGIILFLLFLAFNYIDDKSDTPSGFISQTDQMESSPAITIPVEKPPSLIITDGSDYHVLATKANLFDKPSSDGYILTELSKLDNVKLYNITEGWAKVESDGRQGWVEEKYLAPGEGPMPIENKGIEFEPYVNYCREYKIYYPKDWHKGSPSANADGRKFWSQDKNVVLFVYSEILHANTFFDDYNEALEYPKIEVTYKAFGDSWYVISGIIKESQEIFYKRVFWSEKHDEKRTMTLQYSKYEQAYIDKILTFMVNSFKDIE